MSLFPRSSKLGSAVGTVARSLCLAVPATLSSCAWVPEERPLAPLLSAPGIPQTVATSPDTIRSHRSWPRAEWWKAYHNPKLTGLIETALQNNPNLKGTADRVQQAQAITNIREAELLPFVDARATITANHFPEFTPFFTKYPGQSFGQIFLDPIILRQRLDFWGKYRAATEAAEDLTKAAEAELADARLLLSTSVARNYVALVAATEKSRLAEEMVKARRGSYRVAEVRWQQGLDPDLPRHNSELQLDLALQRWAAAQAEVAVLRDQLARLAGQGSDWGRKIEIAPNEFPHHFPLPDNIPMGLLAHRPDVAATRVRVEAAAKDIDVARTSFYPDVNLVGFAGLQSVKLSEALFRTSSIYSAIGPVIQLPIFQGGRLRAGLAHQQAAYDAAVENYNNTLLRAIQEVADGLARWGEVNQRLEAQEQAVAAMTKNRHLAERLHGFGLNNRSQVFDSRYAALEQTYLLKDLEAEHLQSSINLVQALGGGYYNPEAKP